MFDQAEAGVHRTYVGRLERGESGVTVEALAAILAGLDVSLGHACHSLKVVQADFDRDRVHTALATPGCLAVGHVSGTTQILLTARTWYATSSGRSNTLPQATSGLVAAVQNESS